MTIQKQKSYWLVCQGEHPYAQQIFGSDIDTMVEAAKYVDQNTDCDIIDINMGCPVPKVAQRAQAGAALLKDPDKIYDIIKAIKEQVKKPVTVKIRTGLGPYVYQCSCDCQKRQKQLVRMQLPYMAAPEVKCIQVRQI